MKVLPSVVCAVETWLGEEITDFEISLPDIISRIVLIINRHGGGVCKYILKRYSCKVLLAGSVVLEFYSLELELEAVVYLY